MSPVAIVIALASVPRFVIVAYELPAALVNAAIDRRIGEAIAFRRVSRISTVGDYAAARILAVVVLLVTGFITALTAPTAIGGVLGAAIGLCALVVFSYPRARGVDGGGAKASEFRPRESIVHP